MVVKFDELDYIFDVPLFFVCVCEKERESISSLFFMSFVLLVLDTLN